MRRDESIDDESLPLVQWPLDGPTEVVVQQVAQAESSFDNDAPASGSGSECVHVLANHRSPSAQVNPDYCSNLDQMNPELRLEPPPLPPPHFKQQQQQQDEEPKYARVDLRNKRSSKLATESREGTPMRHRKRG